MKHQRNSKASSNPTPLGVDEQIAKAFCEQEHLTFSRYFFKARQNSSFRVNWHHKFISDTLQKVIDGEIKNLVINVPPGSSKTELAVINFIARGLALNPRARFLHVSYSDDLALKNSQDARDLIQSQEFQELWPFTISDDVKAKKRWNVDFGGKSVGGVYATSLGGQITGFRAGRMEEGFQGALLIDDPLKPEDSFSETKLNAANRKLLSTVKSRKANPDTPIILIMQRIAENDPTGFVVGKAARCEPIRVVKSPTMDGIWTVLTIPAVIDEEYVALLDEKYRAEVIRDAEGRFSYWPYKERVTDLLNMESGQAEDSNGGRISRHVFSSQYQQAPRAIGGNLIRGEWFPRYTVLPKIRYRKIYADTAQKTKERNDFSVFSCYGLGDDGKLYLLDQIRGKWEAPELERRAKSFWAKCSDQSPLLPWATPPAGVDNWAGQLRKMIVEDKSSGTGLIQKIKTLNHIPIEGVERDKDKLTRVMDAQGYLEASQVCVPENAPFTSDFIEEVEAFTADDSHSFDDQVDTLVDAVSDMLSTKNKLEVWRNLI